MTSLPPNRFQVDIGGPYLEYDDYAQAYFESYMRSHPTADRDDTRWLCRAASAIFFGRKFDEPRPEKEQEESSSEIKASRAPDRPKSLEFLHQRHQRRASPEFPKSLHQQQDRPDSSRSLHQRQGRDPINIMIQDNNEDDFLGGFSNRMSTSDQTERMDNANRAAMTHTGAPNTSISHAGAQNNSIFLSSSPNSSTLRLAIRSPPDAATNQNMSNLQIMARENDDEVDMESEADTFIVQGVEVRLSDRLVDSDDEEWGVKNWLARDEYENSYPAGAIPNIVNCPLDPQDWYATLEAWGVSPCEAIPDRYNITWSNHCFYTLAKLARTIVFRNNLSLFRQAIQYALDVKNGDEPESYQGEIVPRAFVDDLIQYIDDVLPKHQLDVEQLTERFKHHFKDIPVTAWRDILSVKYFKSTKKRLTYMKKDVKPNHDPLYLSKAVFQMIENAYDRYAEEKGLASLEMLWDQAKRGKSNRYDENNDEEATAMASQVALEMEMELRKRWKRRQQAIESDVPPFEHKHSVLQSAEEEEAAPTDSTGRASNRNLVDPQPAGEEETGPTDSTGRVSNHNRTHPQPAGEEETGPTDSTGRVSNHNRTHPQPASEFQAVSATADPNSLIPDASKPRKRKHAKVGPVEEEETGSTDLTAHASKRKRTDPQATFNDTTGVSASANSGGSVPARQPGNLPQKPSFDGSPINPIDPGSRASGSGTTIRGFREQGLPATGANSQPLRSQIASMPKSSSKQSAPQKCSRCGNPRTQACNEETCTPHTQKSPRVLKLSGKMSNQVTPRSSTNIGSSHAAQQPQLPMNLSSPNGSPKSHVTHPKKPRVSLPGPKPAPNTDSKKPVNNQPLSAVKKPGSIFTPSSAPPAPQAAGHPLPIFNFKNFGSGARHPKAPRGPFLEDSS